jgi:DNA-binding response OmpR family regulator
MRTNRNKIILLEDDETLGYLLTEYLKMNDFEIFWAKNGADCLKLLHQNDFDLAILDVMLPDIDGFEMAQKINAVYPDLSFLFLTARSLKIDVLKGFALGAVDYLKKPIDEEVLVVRIKALLSRLPGKPQINKVNDSYKLGDYDFNTLNQDLSYKDEKISLTNRENQLLLYLVTHQNALCTHKEILTHLWGKNDYFNKKSLNVFITRLRKYFNKDLSIKIENVHNRGFVFKIDK